MDVRRELQEAYAAGREDAVQAQVRDWKGIPYVIKDDGSLTVADSMRRLYLEGEPQPIRRSGGAELHELDSFINFTNRYRTGNTMALADQRSVTVKVVFNPHPAGSDDSVAGWGDFFAVYVCPKSPEWLAWCSNDGKVMTQAAFADWLDLRYEELASKEGFPRPAEMIEMARNLMVKTGGTYRRQINPTDGTGELIMKTEHSQESTKIHRAFALALRVFEGGAPYAVEARIQFRLVEGNAVFSYVMHRRAEVERDAFNDVRKAVEDRCKISVFAGAR